MSKFLQLDPLGGEVCASSWHIAAERAMTLCRSGGTPYTGGSETTWLLAVLELASSLYDIFSLVLNDHVMHYDTCIHDVDG